MMGPGREGRTVIDREHPGDDLWLDVVNGLADASARSAALRHARDCASCARRLEEFAATHARGFARADAALGGARAARPWRGDARRLLPVAAAVAAVLGAYAVWTVSRPAAPPAPGTIAWLPAPAADVLTRSAREDATDARLLEGLDAYAARDAGRARRLLATARAAGALEQVRLLYLGNAELQLGHPGRALAALRAVELARVPEPWRSEARWSMALALDGAGDPAAADSIRRALAAAPIRRGDGGS
jgi:hypothetical protein